MADISVKTQKAQLYLNDINDAINRDKLLLEEWQKNIQTQELYIDSLKNEIIWLKEQHFNELLTLNTAKEKNSADMILLNGQKLELMQKLVNINENIEKEVGKLQDIVKSNENEKEKLSKEYLLLVDSNNNEKEKLNESLKDINDKILLAQDEYNKKEKENILLNITINNNQDILAKQSSLLSDLLEKQNKLDSLNSNIDSLIEEVKSLNTKKSNLSLEINELETNQTNIKSELNILEWHKSEIMKQKVILSQEREVLQQKEERLRFVCEQAGITL